MGSRPDELPGSFSFGDDFLLDVRAYELRSAGVALKLKPIPMELLLFLIEHRGELVTREQIVERIWGKGVYLDSDNSINAAISRIRQVLRDDADQPRFVQTVTGKGYRFIAPVENGPLPVSPGIPEQIAPVLPLKPAEGWNWTRRRSLVTAGATFLILIVAGFTVWRVVSPRPALTGPTSSSWRTSSTKRATPSWITPWTRPSKSNLPSPPF